VPLVGASAGIFGVLIAAAHVAPNAMIMMMFPPVPMRLRTLAWVFIAIAVYTVFTRGRNAGGEAAHLGGAIVGFLLMQGERILTDGRRAPRGFPLD
jgi:membrane associated rhomboid family serine protease